MGRALTVAELAQRMELDRGTICMCVRRLLDLGLLERSGRHNSRTYKTVAGAIEPPDRRGHRRGTDQARASIDASGWVETYQRIAQSGACVNLCAATINRVKERRMDIKDFLKEALCQIANGTAEANR